MKIAQTILNSAMYVLFAAVFVSIVFWDEETPQILGYDWQTWVVCGVPYLVAIALAIYAYITLNQKPK